MIRRLVLSSLLVAGAWSGGTSAAAATPDGRAAARGAAYLAGAVGAGGDGQAADALVALRATGRLSRAQARRRAAALRAGVGGYATTAGSTAKVILGLAAARSGSARCAGRVDLLRRLQGFGRHGRYGTTVFDHTLGMLAMRALRAGPPTSAVRLLLRARGGGGWNFQLRSGGGGADDVTSTALAIVAARAAGVPRSDGTLRAGLRWLRAQRGPSGGFAFGRRDRVEANSTALAVMAQRAMGARDTRGAAALRSLQRGGGAFQFTRDDAGSRVLASNDAVVALTGRALPVTSVRRTPGACR